MNPPGVYDKDPGGFFFIPTYNPKSGNFYIRAAIEDHAPFSVTKASRTLSADLDRQPCRERDPPSARDSVFAEGWALYGEEMLLREGLYRTTPQQKVRCYASAAIAPRALAWT